MSLVNLELIRYCERAATMLDCAVQLCGDPDLGKELDTMEARLDEIVKSERAKSDRWHGDGRSYHRGRVRQGQGGSDALRTTTG